MGLTIKPNQPIIFNAPEVCEDEPDFIQIIDITDETQVQVILEPCANAFELVSYPDFGIIPLTDYWYTEGFSQTKFNSLCKDAGVWGLIEQNNVCVAGQIYQVSVTVSEIFGEIGVYNGSLLIGTITQNGTTNFIFEAENPYIKVWVTDGNYEVCVHSISVKEINQDFLVAIRNYDTNVIEQSFTLASNPERFVFAKNTATISIPWADYNLTGCYYISIDDACTNTCGQLGIFNASESFIDNFNSNRSFANAGWSISGTGTITSSVSGGKVTITGSVGSVITITNDTFRTCAKAYRICHAIGVSNGDVYYTIGDVNSTTVSVTEVRCLATVTPTIAGQFSITLTQTGGSPMTVSWDYITLELVNSDYEFQYDSIPFKLGTFNCTKLINLSNNNDAFGFVFENSFFAPRVRIDATLRNAKYNTERKIQFSSDGKKQTYHGIQRKSKELATEGLPEYILDFLALLPMADHIFVDGTEYHAEDDEVNITYPNGIQDFGQIIMLLSEKEQERENRNTGNPNIPISATVGGYIVDPIQKYIILTEPVSGDTVEAF